MDITIVKVCVILVIFLMTFGVTGILSILIGDFAYDRFVVGWFLSSIGFSCCLVMLLAEKGII